MFVPTRIIFGAGKLNVLHEQKLPGKKAMVVISNGKSARAGGYLARLENELKQAGVEHVVFDKVGANPTKDVVMEGAAFARTNHCDFLIALGGGSVMDATKIMAMMATNEGDLWDYVNGGTGKGKTPTKEPLPNVCITTTAGTGSEADQWGVVTNEATHEKIGCGGLESLFPTISIVDPELMLSVPPEYTAYQGFDALFHSVESYISNLASTMSDMFALTAIENIGKYLPRAVKNGKDLEARTGVAFANTLSGIVMTISMTTSEHSIEHAMSAFHTSLPHGAGLIMLSKEYHTHFVNKHCCDDRYVRMAQALGMKDAKQPMDFITALVQLQKECGVDNLKMSDYGIQKSEIDTIARNAKETMGGLFMCDPVQMTHEECVAILEKSYR